MIKSLLRLWETIICWMTPRRSASNVSCSINSADSCHLCFSVSVWYDTLPRQILEAPVETNKATWFPFSKSLCFSRTVTHGLCIFRSHYIYLLLKLIFSRYALPGNTLLYQLLRHGCSMQPVEGWYWICSVMDKKQTLQVAWSKSSFNKLTEGVNRRCRNSSTWVHFDLSRYKPQ